MIKMTYSQRYSEYKNALEQQLVDVMGMLPHKDSNTARAAQYSLFSGGKRVRGVLLLAACDMLCGSYTDALNFAAAVEMIHCYSLIHDDLPCMDDDDMRRGMPSCHKKFGEDIALLAGDCLLTGAFAVVATANLSTEILLTAVQLLSYSAGLGGMIYGQELDLKNRQDQATLSRLIKTHNNKTGALISVSAQLGAIAAGASGSEFITLRDFAYKLGLTFQIIDDILDATSDTKTLGKPAGSDNKKEKDTFYSILGAEKAESYAKDIVKDNSDNMMLIFGKRCSFLLQLQDELLKRSF